MRCLMVSVILLLSFLSLCISEKGGESANQTREVISMEAKIRKPAVAGYFYPGDKETLERYLDELLHGKEKISKKKNKIRAIIVPHAGYKYSGEVAASVYKQIEGEEYDKVIILCPNHTGPLRGISISPYDYYETPLGKVPVSKDKVYFSGDSIESLHIKEHAIEVQLPFLQKVLGDFEIIPIIVGKLSGREISLLADEIIRELDYKTLLVISTDLSHYHQYEEARRLDLSCIDHILKLEANPSNCEACGIYSITVLMEIARRLNWTPELVEYKNSGDVTGNKSRVVGYAGIVFYQSDDEIGAFLVKLARESIESSLLGKEMRSWSIYPEIKEKRAAFVTIEKNGELRGCIGHLWPKEALYLSVIENARNAAFRDPRFPPLRREELKEIEIEVSVLDVPEKMSFEGWEDLLSKIEEGKDGIILVYGSRRATFLPQVWEKLPEKTLFLERLCLKAGLPKDCWKWNDIEVYRYRVKAYSERDYFKEVNY